MPEQITPEEFEKWLVGLKESLDNQIKSNEKLPLAKWVSEKAKLEVLASLSHCWQIAEEILSKFRTVKFEKTCEGCIGDKDHTQCDGHLCARYPLHKDYYQPSSGAGK